MKHRIVKIGILSAGLIASASASAMGKAPDRSHAFDALSLDRVIVRQATTLKADSGNAVKIQANDSKAIVSVTPADDVAGQGQIKIALANGEVVTLNLKAGSGVGINNDGSADIPQDWIPPADSGQGVAASIGLLSHTITSHQEYATSRSCSQDFPHQVCRVIDYPHAGGPLAEQRCGTEYVTVSGSQGVIEGRDQYRDIHEIDIADAAGKRAIDLDYILLGSTGYYFMSTTSDCVLDYVEIQPRVIIVCQDNKSFDCRNLPDPAPVVVVPGGGPVHH